MGRRGGVCCCWGGMGNIWELRNHIAFEEVGLRRGGARDFSYISISTSISLSVCLRGRSMRGRGNLIGGGSLGGPGLVGGGGLFFSKKYIGFYFYSLFFFFLSSSSYYLKIPIKTYQCVCVCALPFAVWRKSVVISR